MPRPTYTSISVIKSGLVCSAAALTLGACMSPGHSNYEQQVVDTLGAGQFQPRTAEEREAIGTQDLLAQAAFWSKENTLNPGDLEAAVELSAVLRKMGNMQQAIAITQTTRALYPRDPGLIAEYAAALIAVERGKEALGPLDTALNVDRTNARLWSLKGAALDQSERYDEARKHYGQALALSPGDPKIMANVGLSYALQGDAPTAEVWLRNAMAQPGAGDDIARNLELVMRLQGKSVADISPAQQTSASSGRRTVSGNQAMPQARMTNFTAQNSPSAAPQRSAQRPLQTPATSRIPLEFNAKPGASASIQVAGNPNAQIGGPKTAMEAAQLAAKQQRRTRGTEPVEMTAEQKSVLAQIGHTVGPAPQHVQPQKRMASQQRAQLQAQYEGRPRSKQANPAPQRPLQFRAQRGQQHPQQPRMPQHQMSKPHNMAGAHQGRQPSPFAPQPVPQRPQQHPQQQTAPQGYAQQPYVQQPLRHPHPQAQRPQLRGPVRARR